MLSLHEATGTPTRCPGAFGYYTHATCLCCPRAFGYDGSSVERLNSTKPHVGILVCRICADNLFAWTNPS